MLIRRMRRTVPFVLFTAFLCLTLFMLLGFGPMRNDPFHSPYIDNQAHSLAGNSDTWFHFDYGFNNPPRSVVTLALVNAVQSGLAFELWGPETISEWWKVEPTGRGMVLSIDCATGTIMGGGGCQSKDLMWIGAFGGTGTYYVRVINTNPTTSQFTLTVQGSSVSPAPVTVSQQPQRTPTRALGPAAPTPSRTPSTVALPTPYDDPYHGVAIDGQVHSLPGNSATWYKFDYGTPGDFQFRPQVGFRLVGAAGTGVGFEVWPPERLNQWWLGHPVGRGTVEMAIACECQRWATMTPFPTDQPTPVPTSTLTPAPTATSTPEVPCTKTSTSDLAWFGALGGPGTYYIRVVNKSPDPKDYQLVQFQ